MKNTKQTKTVPPSISRYMSNLGKIGGRTMVEGLKKSGEMDERIKKMTEASLRARQMKKLIKQINATKSV